MMNSDNKKIIGSKISFIVLFMFIFNPFTFCQVNWLTFEEAEARFQTEKRKIFVDVYTDWCGWCKKMDASTFQDKEISEYLNAHYYPIKFDAEHKEDIHFNGQVYKYVKYGKKGYNQLALEILKGKLSYPSIVYIDEELNVIQPIEGYKGPAMFKQIMTYFARDFHKTISWKNYSQSYNPAEALDFSKVVKNSN